MSTRPGGRRAFRSRRGLLGPPSRSSRLSGGAILLRLSNWVDGQCVLGKLVGTQVCGVTQPSLGSRYPQHTHTSWVALTSLPHGAATSQTLFWPLEVGRAQLVSSPPRPSRGPARPIQQVLNHAVPKEFRGPAPRDLTFRHSHLLRHPGLLFLQSFRKGGLAFCLSTLF